MKYLCNSCSYIYDEAFWDESEEIKPGTKIENLEFCPVCFEKDNFSGIKEEINYLNDWINDKIEKEHNIEAQIIENKIKIIIWDKKHSMEKEHKIASIWLYDEYWDLVEEKFLQEASSLKQVFENYYLDIFEIRIKCNKHWIFAKKFEFN